MKQKVLTLSLMLVVMSFGLGGPLQAGREQAKAGKKGKEAVSVRIEQQSQAESSQQAPQAQQPTTQATDKTKESDDIILDLVSYPAD